MPTWINLCHQSYYNEFTKGNRRKEGTLFHAMQIILSRININESVLWKKLFRSPLSDTNMNKANTIQCSEILTVVTLHVQSVFRFRNPGQSWKPWGKRGAGHGVEGSHDGDICIIFLKSTEKGRKALIRNVILLVPPKFKEGVLATALHCSLYTWHPVTKAAYVIKSIWDVITTLNADHSEKKWKLLFMNGHEWKSP